MTEALQMVQTVGHTPAETDNLRLGVRTLFRHALRGPGDAGWQDPSVKTAAEDLERICFERSDANWAVYGALHARVREQLAERWGDFLEETLGQALLGGRITPAELLETAEAAGASGTSADPRKQYRALFYACLAEAEPDDGRRRELARGLERGCYNAAIDRCKKSENAYRRNWDAPMFLSVYSSRCGIVYNNIRPGGIVARGCGAHIPWALERLIAGDWDAETLGAMTEAELCPAATAADRREIDLRLRQKVVQKTSTLFACPRCKQRKHTYRQVQIGAADEPSTFMCTCVECGENFQGRA